MSHPCLGLLANTSCAYDPSSPAFSYFSLGDIVAALSIILLIPQFIRPLYRFRLSVRKITLWHIYGVIGLSTVCVMLAAIFPQIPLKDRSFAYPVLWEFAAATLMIAAYAGVIVASLTIPRVSEENIDLYAALSANVLSQPDEELRVEYGRELQANIIRIARMAEFVHRHRKTSAFFDFTHRKKIAASSTANALMVLIGDPEFCGTIVVRAPHLAAALVRKLVEGNVDGRVAKSFVGEISQQAITKDSILSREYSYSGFHATQFLSSVLFGDCRTLHEFEPFSEFRFSLSSNWDEHSIHRYAKSAELAISSLIKEREFWNRTVGGQITSGFRDIFRQIGSSRGKDGGLNWREPWAAQRSVLAIAQEAQDCLANMAKEERSHHYQYSENPPYDQNLFSGISDIIYNSLECYANDFSDSNDQGWHHCISTFKQIFPNIGDVQDGMDPIQQRLALKFVDGLSQNMAGWYPAISRVLIACMGPYPSPHGGSPKTAFNMLHRAMYRELKRLRALGLSDPEKVGHFLPDNVSFDVGRNLLVYRYASGDGVVTDLGKIRFRRVSLLPEAVAL